MISNILNTNILTKIFGSRNERLLKQYGQVVRQINALEPAISALTDDELRGKTGVLRERVGKGEELDSVLPEAFAVVREAGKRTLQMRHFDMQLIGGMALHYGKIAEMRTGEGKALVATLPAYLNALAERGVHAAHHFRAGRRQCRALLSLGRAGPAAAAPDRGAGTGRLLGRREGTPGAPFGDGTRARREHTRRCGPAGRGDEPLRRTQHLVD